MAAPLKKMISWRTYKTCHHSVHWVRSNLHKHLTNQVRLICTDGVLTTKFSDVQRQQTAEANVSFPRPEEDPSSIVNAALQHEDYFSVKEMVTLQDLFNARVHFGHNSGLRHASMIPFIFGERQAADIIDLEKTLPLLHHALNVSAHIVYRGGMVLFLSRNMQVLPWVERMAKEVGEYAHCRPWKKGTFTDAANSFGTLPIFPDLCVFFNTQDTVFDVHRAISEAAKLLVPTIGILDTNCDIEHVTYPIPGNDDSPVSQHLFIDLFRRTVLRAKEKRKEDGVEAIHNVNEIS